MKPLSKEAEQKILRASGSAAEYVNDGLSPNDAIVKAASEAQLPPGHVGLLVCAYNTGRTTRQREGGETLFEKAADFELADTGTALERLYPSTAKTAAQSHRETVVSFEYAVSPRGLLERRRGLDKLASTRDVDFSMCASPPSQLPVDEVELIKAARAKVSRGNHQVEVARATARVSLQKAAEILDEIRTHFREPGHMPFGDAAKEVELRHGRLGKSLMDKVAAMEPLLAKEAATSAIYMGRNPLLNLVDKFLNQMHEHLDLNDAHLKMAVEMEKANEETLRPFVSRPPYTSILDGEEVSLTKSGNAMTWGVAGGTMKDMMGGLAKSIAPPDDKLLERSMNKLTDPMHEATLRNIRMQASLQDLMTNDPVISGYDPESEVLPAFNEVAEVSPRAVDSRLIMQSLLRKRLQQGHLDPFEIDQLLGMEAKLKKRDEAGRDEQSSNSIF